MHDEPTAAIRHKKDSSMVVGLRLLAEGKGDAFVSAGSTGALLAGATLIVKRLKGVKRGHRRSGAGRPAALPAFGRGRECGMPPRNAECLCRDGQRLCAERAGPPQPHGGPCEQRRRRYERHPVYVEAHRLLRENKAVNFTGNIEPRDVPAGAVDVVVCDGFTGNVILKLTEGLAKTLVGQLKGVFMKSLGTKLAYLLVRDGMKDFKKKMDADEHGGALMLGVSKPVIKAHGSSKARAFQNAIRQAKQCVESGVVEDMRAKLGALSEAEEERA